MGRFGANRRSREQCAGSSAACARHNPARAADLWVSADLHTEKRLRQVQDDYGYGTGYGNSYGRYGNQYGCTTLYP